MTHTEQTPLQRALAGVVEFARTHGVTEPIRPDDFGIQRSEPGLTNATYIGSEHAIVATVERDGTTNFGVGWVTWIHLESDPEREPCEDCGECEDCGISECGCPPLRPLTTIYLPGDGPTENGDTE